jgi:hypothetical protein
MQAPIHNPAVVASFYSVEEAEIACAQLAGSGIAARVEGQHAVGVLPMHAIALGGVRVVVDASELERAQELLDAMAQGETGAEEVPGSSEAERVSEDAGDSWMRKAAFAGFLGLCLCPLVGTLYSLILLARYSSLPRSHRGTVHRRLAIAFDLAAVALFAIWRIKLGSPG